MYVLSKSCRSKDDGLDEQWVRALKDRDRRRYSWDVIQPCNWQWRGAPRLGLNLVAGSFFLQFVFRVSLSWGNSSIPSLLKPYTAWPTDREMDTWSSRYIISYKFDDRYTPGVISSALLRQHGSEHSCSTATAQRVRSESQRAAATPRLLRRSPVAYVFLIAL